MFGALRSFFAGGKTAHPISVTIGVVRLDLPVWGWKHFGSDEKDRIEFFRKGRKTLSIHLRKYKRGDGSTPDDDMVRSAVMTLSREFPTEVFSVNGLWIGHYVSGESGCDVDNWNAATLSKAGELLVATLIVLFTDKETHSELRTALSEAKVTRVYTDI